MIKRYEPRDGGFLHAMAEASNGDYVRHSDYKLMQDALDISTGVNRTQHAELQVALRSLDRIRSVIDNCETGEGEHAIELIEKILGLSY